MRTVTVDEEESTIIIYDNWRQVGQTTGSCSQDASSLLPHTTSEVSLLSCLGYFWGGRTYCGIHHHFNLHFSFIVYCLGIFQVTQVHYSFIG